MENQQTNYKKKIIRFVIIILLVIILAILALFVGAAIGYAVIGEGSNPLEVLNPELWQHIFNFFT